MIPLENVENLSSEEEEDPELIEEMDKEINKSDEYSSLSDVDEVLPAVDLDQEELKDLDETPPPPPPPRPLPVKKRVVRRAEVYLKNLFLVVFGFVVL